MAQAERPRLVFFYAPQSGRSRRVEDVPTLVVVDGKKVRRRLVAPRGCREIEQLLAPWLR